MDRFGRQKLDLRYPPSPVCRCGDKLTSRVVETIGKPNLGRMYYICRRCRFFQWRPPYCKSLQKSLKTDAPSSSSVSPTRTSGVRAGASSCSRSMEPPIAKKVRHQMEEMFGDVRVDHYYWLRDDSHSDSQILDYLREENAYTDYVMSGICSVIPWWSNFNSVYLPCSVIGNGQYYFIVEYDGDLLNSVLSSV